LFAQDKILRVFEGRCGVGYKNFVHHPVEVYVNREMVGVPAEFN